MKKISNTQKVLASRGMTLLGLLDDVIFGTGLNKAKSRVKDLDDLAFKAKNMSRGEFGRSADDLWGSLQGLGDRVWRPADQGRSGLLQAIGRQTDDATGLLARERAKTWGGRALGTIGLAKALGLGNTPSASRGTYDWYG
jgi:hypothetical protein